ncbi:MAG: 30S ribosome-binding factor RbfA [Christensenellaceae bacterium]
MQHFGGRDSKPERKLMASVRYDRINEEIKKALSEIVREMKDPRISPMTTIMLVEATNDLKLAKVRVSVYDKDDSVRKETVAQLNRAEGFIARGLGAESISAEYRL